MEKNPNPSRYVRIYVSYTYEYTEKLSAADSARAEDGKKLVIYLVSLPTSSIVVGGETL